MVIIANWCELRVYFNTLDDIRAFLFKKNKISA